MCTVYCTQPTADHSFYLGLGLIYGCWAATSPTGNTLQFRVYTEYTVYTVHCTQRTVNSKHCTVIIFPPNLQNIINHKPFDLGTWNVGNVSHLTCHMSRVTCHDFDISSCPTLPVIKASHKRGCSATSWMFFFLSACGIIFPSAGLWSLN